MLSIEVQNRIRQFNPWLLQPEKAGELIGRFLPDPYVRRDGEDNPLLSDRATLLVGPRQAGKSTLVWSRLKSLAPDILFFNMEDILLRTGCASAIDVADHIRKVYPFIREGPFLLMKFITWKRLVFLSKGWWMRSLKFPYGRPALHPFTS
ncbi:MAG: hypothetical protein Q7J31_18875 [Syntrophales bacterium]|nr:hypothetical protein [Syntrophales bacterium]